MAASDSSRDGIRVECERTSPVTRSLSVEIAPERVSRAFDRAYADLRKNARVKGFRPGKVPRSVLEKLYGDSIPDEIERLNRRLNEKIEKHRHRITEVVQEQTEDAEVVVFAYGSVSRAAHQAVREVREKGLKAGLLRPRTLWPFPEREVHALGGRARAVIVPELNLGQMAHEVEWALRGTCPVVPVGQVNGQALKPSQIREAIEKAAGR